MTDAEPNRAKQTIFREFCLPERQVSLKIVFDHLRNWVIVGGTFLLGGKALMNPAASSTRHIAGIACFGVGLVLVVCLIGQAVFLFEAFTDQIADDAKARVKSRFTHPSRLKQTLATMSVIAVGVLFAGFALAIFQVGSETVTSMLTVESPSPKP